VKSEKLEIKKFTLTVEGETEMWYFNWLQDQINASPERKYNVSIDAKKQQSPKKFFKGLNAKTTPKVIHICDVESNEPVHVDKFQKISWDFAAVVFPILADPDRSSFIIDRNSRRERVSVVFRVQDDTEFHVFGQLQRSVCARIFGHFFQYVRRSLIQVA
jgi:hypothetical protein